MATESNYCAANHFLDYFARYLRRGPGGDSVPGAFALGFVLISEAGYLHDNADIEGPLVRKGVQSIDADELLQTVDTTLPALAPFASSQAERAYGHGGEMRLHQAFDELVASNILIGTEAFGLRELRNKGFDGTNLA